MYVPGHFSVKDAQEHHSFIESNGFGQLISQVDGELFSSHLPFLLSDDRTTLIGHLARQNPQHGSLHEQRVLVTFQGPHDYVSPRWYDAPGVPTWNYQALHVNGTCRVFEDAPRLERVVDQLTKKYESGAEQPWQPEYNSAMLRAIVGVEIAIDAVHCKYKLSQNRAAAERETVAAQLEANGSMRLAQAMNRWPE